MKPARFLLPISVLILGMSQSALAEKDGTAETVEAEKKEAPAPWAGSTVVYSNFARIQTTYDYATSRCGNAGTNAADPVNIDADGCRKLNSVTTTTLITRCLSHPAILATQRDHRFVGTVRRQWGAYHAKFYQPTGDGR